VLANLAVAAVLVAATAVVHGAGLVLLSRVTHRATQLFGLARDGIFSIVAMMLIVLAIFVLHLVEAAVWAFGYLALGSLPDFETALYFSAATFSTIGYGDVTIIDNWQLLSALEGIAGFIFIGWSTAYLVAASTRHTPFKLDEL
jgi:hypothetical protein